VSNQAKGPIDRIVVQLQNIVIALAIIVLIMGMQTCMLGSGISRTHKVEIRGTVNTGLISPYERTDHAINVRGMNCSCDCEE
jgi:hypothetical protein